MVRPRDGHDMRILASSLAVTPEAEVRWAFDTFGNSVALLSFREPAAELVITSELIVRRYGYDEPIDRLARHTGPYPFLYEPEEMIDLAPMLSLQHPEDKPALRAWMKESMPSVSSGAIQVLNDLSGAIHSDFTYGRREVRGVQSPGQTLALGKGTCRDFALLFMEAARCLGFAARFVTGYLYDAASEGEPGDALSGGGSTHAWADVFVPGAGWVEFDPTNRIVAGKSLLRVAATRTPFQALPVSGTYSGSPADFLGMDVMVAVRQTRSSRVGSVLA
jgi:transglutaminase-like putative cysteine protease